QPLIIVVHAEELAALRKQSYRAESNVWRAARSRPAITGRPAVIAAEEGRADPVVWVKDAISIVVIGRNPVIIAGRVGGDCKEDGIMPPRPRVSEAITPRANAIF